MTRAVAVGPATLRAVRRDPRYRGALAARIPRPDWRSRGSCLVFDPDLFFPASTDDPAPALAICRHCAVQAQCLAAALNMTDCEGVWGATTQEERHAMQAAWTLPAQRAARD